MKSLRIVAALLAATFTVNAALAADADDRPAGVEAKDWLPISERLGFVVAADKDTRIATGSRQILLADPARVSAELAPPKKGYFVIKTNTGWQRVVVSDLSDVAG